VDIKVKIRIDGNIVRVVGDTIQIPTNASVTVHINGTACSGMTSEAIAATGLDARTCVTRSLDPADKLVVTVRHAGREYRSEVFEVSRILAAAGRTLNGLLTAIDGVVSPG
jgi:hypothetical protein